MEIRKILDEKTWEKFVLSQAPRTPFLQAWAWGMFQDSLGLSLYRFGLFDKDELIGGAQILIGERKLGRFIYVPHGPLVKSAVVSRKPVVEILKHLKELAREEKADYLRVEPAWEAGDPREDLLRQAGFRPANVPSQAGGTTLFLDLNHSEEELLAGMRKTTRYLVRKGVETDIEVRRSRNPEEMQVFHRLMEETRKRQSFIPHSRRYYQLLFETLSSRRMAELFIARHGQDDLAASVIIDYGDSASYLCGASIRQDVPASYVLQWEVIKKAKESKHDLYDFWGVAPTDDPRHPWYGYSLFKRGFGGYRFRYTGAWDFPVTPRYLAVAGKEWLWKRRRRL